MFWNIVTIIGICSMIVIGLALVGNNNHILALGVSIVAIIGAFSETLKERYAQRCNRKARNLDRKVNEHIKQHHMKATKR